MAARSMGRSTMLLLALLAACGRAEGPELPIAERVPLPAGSFSTLFVDSAGGSWLGGEGEVRRVGGGRPPLRVPVGGDDAPRVLGAAHQRLYVRAGDRLLALDPDSGRELAAASGVEGHLLPDARGRFLLEIAASGAVFGRSPTTLEPFWAWPSLGVRVAAATPSAEGDRLYMALSGDGRATLLGRDLQTGRTLESEELSATVAALGTGRGGSLIALAGSAGEESVTALAPVAGVVRPLWRRSLRSLGVEGAAELRVDPGGGRAALFAPGNESGLRVLDAETGEPLGSVRGSLLDAAFTADGTALYLLTGSEIRVVRLGR